MENNITADKAGTVNEIKVAAGDIGRRRRRRRRHRVAHHPSRRGGRPTRADPLFRFAPVFPISAFGYLVTGDRKRARTRENGPGAVDRTVTPRLVNWAMTPTGIAHPRPRRPSSSVSSPRHRRCDTGSRRTCSSSGRAPGRSAASRPERVGRERRPVTPEQHALRPSCSATGTGGPSPAPRRGCGGSRTPTRSRSRSPVPRGERLSAMQADPTPRRFEPIDVTVRRGIPVTTPVRTIFDLAGRQHPRAHAARPQRPHGPWPDQAPRTGRGLDRLGRPRTPGHHGDARADRRRAREGGSGREQPRARRRGHPRPWPGSGTWSDRSRSTTRTASSPGSTSVTVGDASPSRSTAIGSTTDSSTAARCREDALGSSRRGWVVERITERGGLVANAQQVTTRLRQASAPRPPPQSRGRRCMSLLACVSYRRRYESASQNGAGAGWLRGLGGASRRG